MEHIMAESMEHIMEESMEHIMEESIWKILQSLEENTEQNRKSNKI